MTSWRFIQMMCVWRWLIGAHCWRPWKWSRPSTRWDVCWWPSSPECGGQVCDTGLSKSLGWRSQLNPVDMFDNFHQVYIYIIFICIYIYTYTSIGISNYIYIHMFLKIMYVYIYIIFTIRYVYMFICMTMALGWWSKKWSLWYIFVFLVPGRVEATKQSYSPLVIGRWEWRPKRGNVARGVGSLAPKSEI